MNQIKLGPDDFHDQSRGQTFWNWPVKTECIVKCGVSPLISWNPVFRRRRNVYFENILRGCGTSSLFTHAPVPPQTIKVCRSSRLTCRWSWQNIHNLSVIPEYRVQTTSMSWVICKCCQCYVDWNHVMARKNHICCKARVKNKEIRCAAHSLMGKNSVDGIKTKIQ